MAVEAPEGDALEDLVQRIDRASEGAVRCLDVQQRLDIAQEETETPDVAISDAFLYIENSQAKTDELYFGPISQFGDFSNPPPIDQMPEWALVTWERCADRVTAPVARARFHDLCFITRRGDRRDHARAAVEAYIELAGHYPNPPEMEEVARIQVALGAVKALERALDLARRTGQEELAAEVLRRLVDAARIALADKDAGAGVVLGFIEPLAHDRVQADELNDLLATARARYRGDLWNTLSSIQLELSRPGIEPAVTERLHREEIEALLEAAEVSEPMIAVSHLTDAAQRAEKYKLGDLRERAVARLQDFAGQDIGLVRHTYPVSLPRDVVEGLIQSIVGTSTWEEAFLRLVAGEPPSGQLARNQATVADQSQNSFSTFIPVNQLGPDGLPRRTASSDEQRAAYHLANVEVMQLQILGRIYVDALQRIGERFGPIDPEQLAAFLAQHDHVPDAVGAALARALGRFFGGDPEGAACTAVPRIERVARELLVRMRAPVFRIERPTKPGQYAGLGVLLGMLDDRGLDPSWGRFLGTLLVAPHGFNFRNELLHGSVDEVGEWIAGLTLIAALYLAFGITLTPTPPPDQPDE